MAKITYVPKQEGDPLKTIFHGHKFEANKTLHDVKHRPLIRMAAKNPWFRVEDATDEELAEPKAAPSAAPHTKTGVKDDTKNEDAKPFDPNADVPQTSEQYRGYALAWFKTADDSEVMDQRWGDEADLRAKCGCGTDDEEYLATFFNPLRDKIKAAEDAV